MWFKKLKRGRKKIFMLHNVKFTLSPKNKGPSDIAAKREEREGTERVTQG